MSASGTAIGIMDGAFFVGRKEIVDWINNTLQLSINRIEDTCSGAIACQLTDIMYPDAKIPMQKVNWSANKDFEYVANYKILQSAFTKVGVDKYVDVDRLSTGRYMDNLEFMQWFKKFFETHVSSVQNYDPVAVRAKGKGGNTFFPASGKSSSSAAAATKPAAVRAAPSTSSTSSTAANRAAAVPRVGSAPMTSASEHASPRPGVASKATSSSTTTTSATATTSKTTLSTRPTATSTNTSAHGHGDSNVLRQELDQAHAQNEALSRNVNDLKAELEGMEKERDFYFDKLREIEVMLQDLEDSGRGNDISAAIFKILYATAEGFEVEAAGGEEGGQGGGESHVSEDYESF